MRTLTAAIAAAGLVAASAFGAVNVSLSASDTSPAVNSVLVPQSGQAVTVYVWAQAPTPNSGVLALAGYIASSSYVTAAGQQFAWQPAGTTLGQFGESLPAPTALFPGFAGIAPAPNYAYDGLGNPISWDGNYNFATTAYPLGRPAQTSPGPMNDTWCLGGIGRDNGAMNGLASGQCDPSNPAAATSTGTAWVLVGHYTVTTHGAGMTVLSFVDSGGKANAAANGGWYTAGIAPGDEGLGQVTPLRVTNYPSPIIPALFSSSTVDNSVMGKKTLWRTKKNIVRVTLDRSIGSDGVISNPGFRIVECLRGSLEGPDLSSNFSFTLEAGGTVVRIQDTSAGGCLVNRTWYVLRFVQVDNTLKTIYIPLLVGDVDGNSVLSGSGDVSPIAAKLSSPILSNDADRRDVDGNMVISAAGDVSPVVAGLGQPTLPWCPWSVNW